ncbi:MAG: hypothetical protein WCH11_05185 [Bdellovibrio sp.]
MIQESDSFEILVRLLPPYQWRFRLETVQAGSKAAYGEEFCLSSRELIEHLAWGSLDAMAWVWDGETWQRLGMAPWARELWLGSVWLSPWVLKVLREERSKPWVLAPEEGRKASFPPVSPGTQADSERELISGPFSVKEVLQLIRRNRWDLRQIKIWSKALGRWEPIWKIFPKPAWDFLLSYHLGQQGIARRESNLVSGTTKESEI